MKNEGIVRYTLAEIKEKFASGELKDQTDWARVDALTDEDIERAIADDPDADVGEIDWSQAKWVIPGEIKRRARKKPDAAE